MPLIFFHLLPVMIHTMLHLLPLPTENCVEEMKKKKPFTIGISEDYFEGLDPDVAKALEKSIEVFKKLGFKTKNVKLLSPNYAISVYTIIQR